jgi:hypothetical protein
LLFRRTKVCRSAAIPDSATAREAGKSFQTTIFFLLCIEVCQTFQFSFEE